MEARHQFDGSEKTGEGWRGKIRDFLVGRIQVIKWLLKWADDFNTEVVTRAHVESLKPYMDEDRTVINHLLWAFLSVNLTGAAREIFGNAPDSNGLEVWRRIYKHIFLRNEQRRDELYGMIHNPRSAKNAADVAARTGHVTQTS